MKLSGRLFKLSNVKLVIKALPSSVPNLLHRPTRIKFRRYRHVTLPFINLVGRDTAVRALQTM